MIFNPFITSGYVSPDYFCDREEESHQVILDIEGNEQSDNLSSPDGKNWFNPALFS